MKFKLSKLTTKGYRFYSLCFFVIYGAYCEKLDNSVKYPVVINGYNPINPKDYFIVKLFKDIEKYGFLAIKHGAGF